MGGAGRSGENGDGRFGAAEGGADGSGGVASPELTFEDVAELVWDPRSGPKPRGVAETKGPDGARANRAAVERAMWERDSVLLERVAPAHAEKAMQVLQMHRHDVERAGHMLTVRHGIQVVGLSSVRTTRNSRAEQQAASNSAITGSSLSAGLQRRGASASIGGGVSGGGSNGGGGGTGACGVRLPAAEAAAAAGAAATAAAAVRAAGKKTDAQNVTREEARRAADAFKRYGRNLNGVAKALGWKKSRVVEYYYCVWKFSPGYQVIAELKGRGVVRDVRY